MTDLEKVIKGLGCCSQILVADALALLKEQESIKPLITGHGEYEEEGSWWYECGNCGTAIDPDDKYCRKCGKAVKWDEVD